MFELAYFKENDEFKEVFILGKEKKQYFILNPDTEEYSWIGSDDIILMQERKITKDEALGIITGDILLEEFNIKPYEELKVIGGKFKLTFKELVQAAHQLVVVENIDCWLELFHNAVDSGSLNLWDKNELIYHVVINHILNERYPENVLDITEYILDIVKNIELPLKDIFTLPEDKLLILKEAFEKDKEYNEDLNEACFTFLNDSEFDDNLDVILIRAYSYYGGNSFCPCDYKKAEENLLKLVDNGNTYAANSLGYIYYYGRVNDGVPQYDLAYKYFTISALDKEPEAIYKLSDMFKNGYYVSKNYELAARLLDDIYFPQLNSLENGYNNKFADIALRMGLMCENGYYFQENKEIAMLYYVLAKAAMIIRGKYYPQFGDYSVNKVINESIERVNFKYSRNENKGRILSLFSNHNNYTMSAKLNKAQETVVTLKNINDNRKLVCDINKRKYYFTNKVAVIINSKHQFDLDMFNDLEMDVNSECIHFKKDGTVVIALALSDIKVKVYNEL